jgi:hypothetical protein
MKTNKYIFTIAGFLTGMVFGVSVIGLLAFTNGPSSSAPSGGITAITPALANSYVGNYLSRAVSLNQVVKGFTIDKVQLDAMNNIARENTDLTGFRIYLGKDNNANNLGIVVGVDNMGMDAVKNSIFVTASQRLSPCPPICDVSSPIILNN